jgi:hypothetical protein
MLAMAIELAVDDASYEDVASKFFEHFMHITDAMNHLGGSGLWDEQDGFYYDWLRIDGHSIPMRVRSMVGIIPLFAVENLEEEVINRLPGFKKRMLWFLENRKDIAVNITTRKRENGEVHRLLAIPSSERLTRVLSHLLDEKEFLSDYGIRGLSKLHEANPYAVKFDHQEYSVKYIPGESDSGLFGGNSNWRGPIWLPMNYLIVEALKRFHYFYGDEIKVECPTGSGKFMNLSQAADEIARRLTKIFLPDSNGKRPCHGEDVRYRNDPHFKDYALFYEYFHGDSGRGCGASHQTGWTALVAKLMEDLARS